MWKFIAVTFGFLGFAFYEMSGGSDFVPEEREQQAVVEPTPEPEISAEEILATITDEDVAPNAADGITIREGGDVTLAAASELDLDGVPARLTQPIVSEDAANEAVLFASLSVSPDGALPATTEDAVEALVEAVQPAAELDLRFVDASALNVRAGPSTTDAVIGRLTQSEIVTVLSETEDGWANVLIEGDGIEGWVASRFLRR